MGTKGQVLSARLQSRTDACLRLRASTAPARIWDAESGEELAVLRGHEHDLIRGGLQPRRRRGGDGELRRHRQDLGRRGAARSSRCSRGMRMVCRASPSAPMETHWLRRASTEPRGPGARKPVRNWRCYAVMKTPSRMSPSARTESRWSRLVATARRGHGRQPPAKCVVLAGAQGRRRPARLQPRRKDAGDRERRRHRQDLGCRER